MVLLRQTKPIDFPTLTSLLSELFNIQEINSYETLYSGYMSQNFRVHTQTESFFLKCYRDRLNNVLHDIKHAEEYFAQNGLPIILPRKDRYGREAFWCQGSWYSVFPFVSGVNLVRHDLTEPLITSIATTLAKLHEAGERFTYRPFQMMRVGNARKFLMENVELDRQVSTNKTLSTDEEQVKEILSLKRRLFEQGTRTLADFALTFECLLHGDFQHYNLFAAQNSVTHIFDLERTSLGPAIYELTRAIFMDCFEDGWEEQNFAHAHLYLASYRSLRSFSFESFVKAIQFYLYNLIHTSWLEANFVLYGRQEALKMLSRQKNRLVYLSTHDLNEFALTIWE